MWSWPPTPPRSWWFAAGGAGRDIILSGHSLSLRQRRSEEDSHPAPASSTLITGGPTCHHYQTTGEPNAIIDAGGLGSSTANSGASQIEGDFVDAGDSNDLVIASHASDTVLGGQGTDVIWGTGGGDYLSGDADGDFIHGVGSLNEHDFEHAADQLHGNDLVDGGSGINHLDGGAGNDIYTVTTAELAWATPLPDEMLVARTSIRDSEASASYPICRNPPCSQWVLSTANSQYRCRRPRRMRARVSSQIPNLRSLDEKTSLEHSILVRAAQQAVAAHPSAAARRRGMAGLVLLREALSQLVRRGPPI